MTRFGMVFLMVFTGSLAGAQSPSEADVAKTCAAFIEFDEFFASKTPAELEVFSEGARTRPVEERFDHFAEAGFSQETVDFLRDASREEMFGILQVMMALERKNHPEAFEMKITGGQDELSKDIATGMGDAMIARLDAAVKGYTTHCLPE